MQLCEIRLNCTVWLLGVFNLPSKMQALRCEDIYQYQHTIHLRLPKFVLAWLRTTYEMKG